MVLRIFRAWVVALAAAVAGFASTGAQAQAVPTLTQCKLGGKPSGIIAQDIAFSIDPGGKAATVSDAVTLRFEGKPVPAKVTRNTKRKLGLSWKVNNVRNTLDEHGDIQTKAQGWRAGGGCNGRQAAL